MATRQVKAENTSMTFGRGYVHKRTDLVKSSGDKPREYFVTAWNHDEDSAKVESNQLRAGRGSVFGEDGFLWGSGSVGIEIPSEEGFLDLAQLLLNDPNPISTPLAKKTLIPSATDLADIIKADYFTDDTEITIKAVDDQNLSGAGNKTIANDLSNYETTLTLTVTPGDSPALTNASTPATIVIMYMDGYGESQSITLSFADSAKTTAQTTELPVGATLTRIRTTGWTAGKFDITTLIQGSVARNPVPDRPGRLRVEYTGDLTEHTLRIRGVRRVGLASSDTLPLRENITLGADVLTDEYFHKIHTVEIRDSRGGIVSALDGTHTVEITSEPGKYETKMKVTDDDPEGATFEADVAGEPRVVSRGIFISGNIEIGDTIAATFEMLSNRVDKRRTIEERDVPVFVSSMKQYPEEFEGVSRRFYSGYGRFLEIDGEAVICNTVGLGVAHNYDFVQGKVPGRFRRDTDANARRLTTATVNTNYESGSEEEDIFIRWDEKFRNNESVRVRVGTYQWLGDGQQLSIIYDLENCEITAPVRVEANSPGTIPVDINLKGVPPEGEQGGDVKVTIISHDQWKA